MSNNNTVNLLLGALIGGVVIGTAVVALTTNKKKFKRNVNQKFDFVKDKVEDFLDSIHVNGTTFTSNINEHASDWAEKAKDFVTWVQDLDFFNEPEYRNLRYGLVTGGVIIGLLGTAAVAMLATKSNEEDARHFIEKAVNQINAWKSAIKDILKVIESRAEFATDQFQNASKRMTAAFDQHAHKAHGKGSTFNDVIDFASAGLQMWQNMKHR